MKKTYLTFLLFVMCLATISANTEIVQIGNPNNNRWSWAVPWHAAEDYDAGLSQIMYYEEWINTTGLITHIELVGFWDYFDFPTNRNVKLWMTTTTQPEFNIYFNWIPLSQYILVYDGLYPEIEDYRVRTNVLIELTTPFNYTGGNLVIMGQAEFSNVPDAVHWNTEFDVDDRVNALIAYRNSNPIDPASPPYANLWISLRNLMKLYFEPTGPVGTLSGSVTYNGMPVNDVRIAIQNTNRVTFTNELGNYNFINVPIGTYDVTASSFIYNTVSNQNVHINQDQNTVSDFTLSLAPGVTVSGTVISSNTNSAIAGAQITLTGPATFGPVYSGVVGRFSIPNVTMNGTYTLTIIATDHLTYTSSINVLSSTLVLGNINVLEFPYAARNVQAVLDDENEYVEITWKQPSVTPLGTTAFTHSTADVYNDSIGSTGTIFWDFIPVHRFTQDQLTQAGVSGADLTHIMFWVNNTGSSKAYFTLKVYTGGSGDPLNPGTLVHSQEIPESDIVWNEYNVFELSTPVYIPTEGELWFGYQAYVESGFVAAYDIGPALPGLGDVFLWDAGSNPGWQFLSTVGTYGNWLIKGRATINGKQIEIGNIAYSTEDILGIGVSALGNNTKRSENTEETPIRSGENRVTEFAEGIIPRAITGYNVYRSNINNIDNESQWTLLATNLPVTTLSYTDYTWNQLPFLQAFRYIVRAVYSQNNLSAPAISGALYKEAENFVYIGDPTSSIRQLDTPIITNWETGVVQTIYYESEIKYHGLIKTIMLNHYTGSWETNANIVYNIWLAKTDIEYFANGNDWLPFSEFTLVYSGTIPSLAIPGNNDVFIELQTEFPYDGGNLVLMSHKMYFDAYYGSNSFLITQSTNARTIRYRGMDNNLNPPFNIYPDGTAMGLFANMGLMFITDGFGRLAGNVTLQNESGIPVSNVLISINDSERYTYTNNLGDYYIGAIPFGTINITAKKHGFYDSFYPNIVIEEGLTTDFDFQIEAIPTVAVSGRVIASDTMNALVNANVSLEGYGHYKITTNEQGYFEFPYVYTGFIYTLVVSFPGYDTYRDYFVEVGGSPPPSLRGAGGSYPSPHLDLGDIILTETAWKPNNVFAEVVDYNAVITWEPPVPLHDIWMTHTVSNPFANRVGFDLPATMIKAHRYSQQQLQELKINGATITKIEFVPRDINSILSTTILIYTGGSDAPLQPGNLVYSQAVTQDLGPEPIWVSVPLTTPFTISDDEELWIGVEYVVSRNYNLGADEGPHNEGYGNIFWHEEFGWVTAYSLSNDLTVNWSIRAWVEGVPIPDTYRNISILNDNHLRSNNRALTGYRVYRTNIANMDNEHLWIQIIDFTNSLQHTDYTFWQLQHNDYLYGVRAIYTNEVLSDITWSDVVIPPPPPVQYNPPIDFEAVQIEEKYEVLLTWKTPEYNIFSGIPLGYILFRHDLENPLTESLITALDYIDTDLLDGDYVYSIYAVYEGDNLSEPVSAEVNVFVDTSSNMTEIPNITSLITNYPNPFNPDTNIVFDLAKNALVKLEIYNIRGQLIRTLLNDEISAGRYNVQWDGKDDSGRYVATGIYFYQMRTDGYNAIKRMVLMK